jgi:hydrogenase maturation protease
VSTGTILVAGIGNIFLGDDGFGVEVAQQLAAREHADNVRVADYGIRGFDLAFALLDEPAATILVDAMPRGAQPGTVYVLEPDLEGDAGEASPDHADGPFQGHAMTPDAVFALVRALGGRPANVTVVGCEPLTFGPENEGCMGLSEPVAGAVPEAVAIVEQLLSRLVPAVSAP